MEELTLYRHEIKNQEEYGQGFYQKHMTSMRKGYVHPYHSNEQPINLTYMHYLKTLYDAVGPEQVSPHYETLSRSRRGVIFIALYIGTITSISRMGGWSHNEWMRAMIWHHEYMICLYLGYIETRHFSFFLGPKWTMWYSVYSNYETKQLCNMWADDVEETQLEHTQQSKQQMTYSFINQEYDFVKKRSLVNFLTNEKLNLEGHFHERALNMLRGIQRFEKNNMEAHVQRIAEESWNSVIDSVKTSNKEAFQKSSFQSALNGISSGIMSYEGDEVLPMLNAEIEKRTAEFKGLSAEEEGKLLSLTSQQKNTIAEQDRKAKVEYLTKAPKIGNAGVKVHDKFKSHVAMVQSAAKGEVQA
jgi:hypothetical protein